MQDKTQARKFLDEILYDVDLMMSIYRESLWNKEEIKNQVKFHLEENDYFFEIIGKEKVNPSIIEKIGDKVFSSSFFIYRPWPFVSADIYPFLMDLGAFDGVSELSKSDMVSIFRRYSEEIGKRFFTNCFYIDLEKFENYLKEMSDSL